ncbi:MAG: hypothetical protein KDB04_11275 [Acidimicrobiales bacterium]|nr:hypothetical protein [Acidimicrobiales bacterium]
MAVDDAVLTEVLERGVAPGGARPPIDGLRARSTRRRRRRRGVLGASAAVAVVVLAAAAVAVAAAGGRDVDQVRTGRPPTSAVASTEVAAMDRPSTLTIGAVPAVASSTGCSLLEPASGLRTCALAVPGAAIPTSINLSWVPGSATEAVQTAWDAGDAMGVADLLGWGLEGTPGFVDLGGRRVLAFGEVSRVDGSSLGLPDRVASGYAALVGDGVVQISSEAAEDVLAEVVAGLEAAPRWAAVDGVLDLLPAGTEVVGQGVRSRWARATGFQRNVTGPPPATGYGIDLVDPATGRRGVSIEVTDGLDVAAFLDGLRSRSGAAYGSVELDGRRAVRIGSDDAPALGTDVIVTWGPQLLVAVDDDTLLSVVASSSRVEVDLDAVARRVIANLG